MFKLFGMSSIVVLLLGVIVLGSASASASQADLVRQRTSQFAPLALTETAEPRTATPTPAPATETPVPPTETPIPTTEPTATPKPKPDKDPTATPTPVPTAGIPDVAIVKSASVTQAMQGSLVDFTLRVTDVGNWVPDISTVSDSIPNEFEILEVSASRGTASFSGQDVRATIEKLLPGESVDIVIKTRVRTPVTAGQVTNVGTVTIDQDIDLTNNTSKITVEIVDPPKVLPPTGESDTIITTFLVSLGLAISMLVIGWQLRRRAYQR